MDMLLNRNGHSPHGQLEGRLLVSVPGMEQSVFADSIVYICAHSADGAMGFILNKTATITLPELVGHTELSNEGLDRDMMSAVSAQYSPVRIGGPVDENRGFVLHTHDFETDATIPVSETIHLTSTLQVLRAIAEGRGPDRAVVCLGYAGWGAGQLEQEIRENAWLTHDADDDIVFAHNNGDKYMQIMARLGIGVANFISEAGHA